MKANTPIYVMLMLSFNKSFVDAASRLIRTGKLSCRTRAGFVVMQPTGTFTARSTIPTSRMMSSLDVETSSDQQMSQSKKTNSLHTVVVHRNRQSITFREGTPLVFGGSVASTFTEDCHNETDTDAIDKIPLGSLVALVVSTLVTFLVSTLVALILSSLVALMVNTLVVLMVSTLVALMVSTWVALLVSSLMALMVSTLV